MAGGEPRFGTTAIYMPTLLLQTSASVKLKEAHISLVTCQHSASEDLNNVLISRDFSGQPKRELQVSVMITSDSRPGGHWANLLRHASFSVARLTLNVPPTSAGHSGSLGPRLARHLTQCRGAR